jgi:hypothetical protein
MEIDEDIRAAVRDWGRHQEGFREIGEGKGKEGSGRLVKASGRL